MLKKAKDFFGGFNATGPIEYIIVGLGNPGKEYESTRHNAGFLALDYICGKESIETKKIKFKSLCGEGSIGGKRALFLKPSTYMNNSGESVRDAIAFYKVPIENVVVMCDDVSLDVGNVRIRRKGSDGGQKGLRSIIYLTGKDNFPRVRIGVGAKPHTDMDLADWVLSKFTQNDAKVLTESFASIHKAVELIVNGDIDNAMNLVNERKKQ